MENSWEKRWNPFTRKWVIIAARTAERPWSGNVLEHTEAILPEHDPSCYLCAGVTRASGIQNPQYTEPYAFTNDFGTLSVDAPKTSGSGYFSKTSDAYGTCRVLCYTPRHNQTLADLSHSELYNVVELWQKEFAMLKTDKSIKNILIFENKGKVIGVSNPHPHGQIYASNYIPSIVNEELEAMTDYYEEFEECLMCDWLKHEQKEETRIVSKNKSFVALVPFFAKHAYEVHIVPKRHILTIEELNDLEKVNLAAILKTILGAYDALFSMSFPYILMQHNAPVNLSKDKAKPFHFHIEFYPPMRSPDKLKYMAGFESGGGDYINPIAPEQAAQLLRDAADRYKEKAEHAKK